MALLWVGIYKAYLCEKSGSSLAEQVVMVLFI
jgi:VIT1/CCC1 family predicted Fe2+/Mn2+ transporter